MQISSRSQTDFKQISSRLQLEFKQVSQTFIQLWAQLAISIHVYLMRVVFRNMFLVVGAACS